MRQYFKKLTALSVATVLALNLAGVNVYAEGSGGEGSTIEATPYEEEDVPDSDEDDVLDVDNSIESDDDQIQDLVDDEVIEDKQIITGFADLDNTFFALEEKLPIDELGLPELLPVYINNNEEVVYIDVIWTCDDDYENTEYEIYTFSPAWDENVFEIDSELDISIPIITVEINSLVMIVNTINDVEVTTDESSFDFSKGAINGLKDSFIESLSEEQKNNINLVIPNSIVGQKVTAISNNAFYYTFHNNIKECAFNIIDISEATNLISIGSHAFDGVELNQNAVLSLPISNESSMTNIGSYAFNNCRFSGQLVLPTSLIKIGDSAFRMSNESVSFTGELVIPENVETIGSVAFSNQAGLESVRFDSKKITEISASLFKYCKGLNGVLVIPSNIKKIGNHAFNGTNYNAIYLPKRSESNDDFVSERTFGEHSDLNILIICDKSDYDYIYNKTHKWLKSNIGYEMTIDFLTDNGSSFTPITRLYNQPFNLEKQSDGQWIVNNKYSFPSIPNMKWGLSASESKEVAVTDKVTQDKIYSISAVEYPVFTYSIGIDKEYDGEVSVLRVNASHSKAKEFTGKGTPGDVFFYYWWYWDTINPREYVLDGFDANEYEFKDVRNTAFAIGCRVIVQTYVLNANGKLEKLIGDTYHTFSVDLRQAPSIVNPIYSNELRTIGSGLPDINLSAGDTEGTIKWDDGQTITEGVHEYTWTFTPVENSVGSSNYTTVKGKASLNFVQGYNVIKGNITNGDIALDKPYGAVPNDDLTITFKPNSGYKLSSASLDGTDIFRQVLDNKYTIRNIQSNHTLDAFFTSMETKDVENVIESLPDIKDVVITEEVKNDILDAKLHYDAVNGTTGGDIAEDAKEKMYEAISKLDQVETLVAKKDGVNIEITDKVHLLENMETKDAEALKNNNNASLKIELVVENTEIDDEKENVLQAVLGDNIISESFDVSVVKKLTINSNTTEKTLTELKKPIQIVFEIPKDLPSIEPGYVREFSIIRLHNTEDGQIIPEVLKDEDSYEHSISVSSDKFSTYIIVYKDVKKENGSQGGGSGSYSKTYTVTFETLGGSHIAAIKDIKQGKKITKPVSPSRKGYTFTGWFIDAKCTKPFDFTKDTIKADMTLYAGWKKVEETITYNVIFNTLGGNYIPNQSIEEGQKVLVPTVPSKEGYTFIGWYSDKECSQLWDFNASTIYADTVLYAGWQKVDENTNQTIISKPIEEENEVQNEVQNDENTNKIPFEREEGIYKIKLIDTVDPSTIWIMEASEGKKLDLKDMPEKEGYVFKGYFTDEKCTKPWNEDETIQKDISLYAGWDKIEDNNNLNNDEQNKNNINNAEEEITTKSSDSTSIIIISLVVVVIIGGIVVILRKKKK